MDRVKTSAAGARCDSAAVNSRRFFSDLGGAAFALVAASMRTMFLADVLGQGVRIEPHEAVAIAQLLIDGGAVAPSPENVQLSTDGTAWCVGCDVTPAVFEIAGLLQKLIPSGAPGVSGALRYVIARGLLDVDAPPFDSLAEFSRTLERFERGDRAAVVRALIARHVNPVVLRIVPRVTPLRDRAPVQAPSAAEIVPMPRRVRPRDRRAIFTAAAMLAGAIALIGVAGVMNPGHVRPRTVAGAAPGDAPAPASVVASPRTSAVATAGTAGAPSQTAAVDPAPSPLRQRGAQSATPQTRRPPSAVSTLKALPEDGAVVPALDGQRRPIFSPSFASNGSALFFHTGGSRDAPSAIATASVEPDGGGDLGVMTIVDDGARNYHVQLSPDGAYVAFDSDRDGERGVYVARRDGTNVRRISGPGYAAVPTWAPDGRRIAYIRAEADSPKVWNLWLQAVDGDHATRLTDYRYGQTWSASWFPDNRRICYSHEDRLVVHDLESGASQTFTSPVKHRLVRTPAVSPDGRAVIFQVFRQGAWLLDLRDGSMRPVLADPTAEEFAWSPDGRRVAFHSRRDGQWGIFVISPG